MSVENKDIIRRFYEEVWDKANIAVVDELFADDFFNHNPSFGLPGDREGFKQYVTRLRDRFNFRPTIEELIAERDKVVARLTGHGRLKRRFMGITLIDRRFAEPVIIVWRIADGKIVERWST